MSLRNIQINVVFRTTMILKLIFAKRYFEVRFTHHWDTSVVVCEKEVLMKVNKIYGGFKWWDAEQKLLPTFLMLLRFQFGQIRQGNQFFKSRIVRFSSHARSNHRKLRIFQDSAGTIDFIKLTFLILCCQKVHPEWYQVVNLRSSRSNGILISVTDEDNIEFIRWDYLDGDFRKAFPRQRRNST